MTVSLSCETDLLGFGLWVKQNQLSVSLSSVVSAGELVFDNWDQSDPADLLTLFMRFCGPVL